MKKNALICGASQGIGLALVKELLNKPNFSNVFATHRIGSDVEQLSLLKESYPKKLTLLEYMASSQESLDLMVNHLGGLLNSIDLVINCIGFLTKKNNSPEKSIDEVNSENLIDAFQINALTTLLLAKKLKPFLQKNKSSVLIALSAKVGSIEDNRTGGWYSYRVSKAALNMCIKNLSIEFNRMGNKITVFAIHPGTTETRLTTPFLKNAKKKYTVHSTLDTACNILQIALAENNHDYNGRFISWDGSEIPW